MIKKKFFTSILILFSISLFASNADFPKKRVIVIDAGHGGKDTGAKGSKSNEKDIVLAIALKVGNYIEQNMSNVKVIYTRKTDVFIPLNERANIANKNNADLFVSIHANSTVNKKAYGTETFVMGLHKTKGNLEVAKAENAVIVYEDNYETKYEGFDPNSAESYIIFSLMQNAFLEQSLSLAAYIQKEFKHKAKRYDRGVKQAGFLVLWKTTMPSILVETGFVSNPKEEQYLLSENGQSYLASSIYRSIKKYFSDIDKEMLAEKKKEDKAKAKQNTKQSSADEVVFRVQVLTASKPINTKEKLAGFANVYSYKQNNMYKYTIGKYTKLKDAKNKQKEIKEKFPDAFIVAFRNNKKISLKQALKK